MTVRLSWAERLGKMNPEERAVTIAGMTDEPFFDGDHEVSRNRTPYAAWNGNA
jgi:hypothetical protein